MYGFVKRIPFSKPLKLRLRTAREVIDAGRGDADDKATVLIALLRAAGIPARLRYIELRGEILRGLTSGVGSAARPLAEIWLGERWMRTDTYIFDAAYMAAARQRLKNAGWEWGYAIHRDGNTLWNGAGDAYLGGSSDSAGPDGAGRPGLLQRPARADLVRSLAHRTSAPGPRRAVEHARADDGKSGASSCATKPAAPSAAVAPRLQFLSWRDVLLASGTAHRRVPSDEPVSPLTE